VESLETRTLLSISFSGPNNSGMATVVSNAVVIQLNPNDNTKIELSDDGGQTFTDALLSGITGITVNGSPGRDVLTINEDNGLIGLSASLAMTFNGGNNRNVLFVTGRHLGAGMVTETYSAGANAGSATLTIGNGTLASTITLNDISHVFDSLAADSLTINGNDQNNLIQIRTGPSLIGVHGITVTGVDVRDLDESVDEQARLQADDDNEGDDDHHDEPGFDNMLDETNAAFPPITFTNKTNVVINGVAGDNLFVLMVHMPSSGLQSLTINGGTGSDNVVAERFFPDSVTLTLQNIHRVDNDRDSIFVDEVFAERLGRPADDVGFNNFKQFLQTNGRLAVVQGVEESLEGRMDLAQHLFQRFLGRNPMMSEQLAFANALNSETEEQVVIVFLSSTEFFNRAQTLVATGTPDERFITAAFQFVLNRAPTSQELAARVNQLATSGATAVVTDLVESVEFRSEMVSAFFGVALHRDIDAGTMLTFATSDLDLRSLRDLVLASDEAFDEG
jgi:hypothetical protein